MIQAFCDFVWGTRELELPFSVMRCSFGVVSRIKVRKETLLNHACSKPKTIVDHLEIVKTIMNNSL